MVTVKPLDFYILIVLLLWLGAFKPRVKLVELYLIKLRNSPSHTVCLHHSACVLL